MNAIRFAAIGAALAFGASVAAAQPPVQNRAATVAGARHQGGQRHAGRTALFRGVSLSETQKTQLKTIHQKYATERRTLLGSKDKAAGAQRQHPDSATRVRMRGLMDREMTETRGLLTGDQQKTFDQNVTTVRQHVADRQAKHAKRARKA